MYDLNKKSIDPNVNKLLPEIFNQNIKLSWDLHEANLPKCGFGRLGLCCNECWQGPCRVDPFDNGAQAGSCGRTGISMITENFSRQVIAGLIPFLDKARNRELNEEYINLNGWLNAGMNNLPEKLLQETFEISRKVLRLSPEEKILKLERVNVYPNKITIVIVGLLSSEKLDLLKKSKDVQVFSLLNEFSYEGIQPLTNYGSQEIILSANIPDLLVIGPGCGMPNLIHLAEKYKILYVYSNDLTSESIPKNKSSDYKKLLDFNTPSFKSIVVDDLKGKKVALIAGCNNINRSQDAGILNLTKELLSRNYSIVTTGCAAMALVKYLSDYKDIYYLGSCYNTAKFINIYDELKYSSRQITAFFPELSQPKAFAQAVGFAANDIQTYIFPMAPIAGNLDFTKLLTKVNKKLKISSKGFEDKEVLEQIL